jgi:hypothetical protein
MELPELSDDVCVVWVVVVDLVVLSGVWLEGEELDGEALEGELLCGIVLLGLAVDGVLLLFPDCVLCDCELLVSGVCAEPLLCATTHTDDNNRIAVIR